MVCYAAPSEFQVKLRSVESAPLVFGDHEIARFGPHFWHDVRPVRRRILKLHGGVGDGMQGVFSVRRQSHPHQKNRHAVFPASFGQSRRVSYHGVRRMRGVLPPDNAFLKVYDHQRRLGSVNQCVFHNRHRAALTVGRHGESVRFCVASRCLGPPPETLAGDNRRLFLPRVRFVPIAPVGGNREKGHLGAIIANDGIANQATAHDCDVNQTAWFCSMNIRTSEWRREGDSNPRCFLGTHAFQACALNHSAISPPRPNMWHALRPRARGKRRGAGLHPGVPTASGRATDILAYEHSTQVSGGLS